MSYKQSLIDRFLKDIIQRDMITRGLMRQKRIDKEEREDNVR